MGIRFHCPNGHKINVKSFLAGKRALCPTCGAKVVVPLAADTDAPVAASLVADIDAQRGGLQSISGGIATQTAPAIPLASQPKRAAEVVVETSPTAQPAQSDPQANVAAPQDFAASVPAHPAPQAPPPAPPGFRDPIAEAPQAVWYVRPRAGGQYGPAAGDVFRQWLAENRVTPDSYVWRDGWPDWRVASEALPQLAAQHATLQFAAPQFAADPYRANSAMQPQPTMAAAPSYAAAEAAAPIAVALTEVDEMPAAKRPVRIRQTSTSSVVAVGLLALVALILVGVLVIVVMNQS